MAGGLARRLDRGNVRRFSRRRPDEIDQAALYAGMDAFRAHWPWLDGLWGVAAPRAAMPCEPFMAFLRTYQEQTHDHE